MLRYSARQRLIEHAATLGIRRFDANLLIAAVQHRLHSESNPLEFPPAGAIVKQDELGIAGVCGGGVANFDLRRRISVNPSPALV